MGAPEPGARRFRSLGSVDTALRRIRLEAGRAAGDRRRLLLLREELKKLLAEIECEQSDVATELSAATTNQVAALAYLRVGQTIMAAAAPANPPKEPYHVSRRYRP